MGKRFKATYYSFAHEPTQQFFRLSRKQVESMNLVGLPVRIEHKEGTIGRVISASVGAHEAVAEYELDDTTFGLTAAALTDLGRARGVSLKHRDVGGVCTPIELSVCVEGARPDTRIHINDPRFPAVKAHTVMASAAAPEPVAEAPAPVAAGAPDEPVAKSARLESGADHMRALEDIANQVTKQAAGEAVDPKLIIK